VTSPLPPRLRDSRNLADLVRQQKQNGRQLDGGLLGGRWSPAKPLGATAQMGDLEDDEGSDDDLPAAINTDVAYASTAGQITLNLTYVPIEGTLLVFWDDGDLIPSEYVLAGQTIIFTDRHVHVGDRLHAVYWYWPSDVPVYEAPQPAAWYRLNETIGTATMADSSGNGHDGSYNAVSLEQTGLLTGDTDMAGAWNGTTAHAEVPYGSWMDAPTMSGAILLKGAGSGYGTLMARDDGNTGRMWALVVGVPSVGGGNLAMILNGIFFGPTITTTGLSLNDGNRHMGGFSYDGTTLKLYADGALVKTSAASITTVGAAKLSLGAAPSGSGGSWVNLYTGTLDEGRYYPGQALTDADHAALWAEATT
jgi:hypothetical protein